jgi:hypothetical protein
MGPAKYFGHWAAVTGGTVTGIIPVKNPTPRCAVDVLIDEGIEACILQSEASYAEQLHPGQPIAVGCIAGMAGPNGEVYLNNCTIGRGKKKPRNSSAFRPATWNGRTSP